MADTLPDGFTIDDVPAAPNSAVAPRPAISYSMDKPPEGFTVDEHPAAIQPPTEESFNRAAGSFATGANRAIAATFGAPVDLATGALNLPIRGYNYFSGSNVPTIQNPVGGSQSIMDAMKGTIGETEPQTNLDKNLAAAGAGVGGTASSLLGAGLLNSAGLLPRFLQSLSPSPSVAAGIVKPSVYGAAAGEGSYYGKNLAGALTDNDPMAMALGGTAGGFLGGAGSAFLGETVPYMARTAIAPFTQAGREKVVGNILNETAANKDIASTMPDQFPAGINPTTGQASNDPGLLALERSVAMRNPQVQGQFLQQQSGNNALAGQQLDNIGTAGNAADISTTMAGRLDALRQTAKQGVTDAYSQVPADTPIPTQPLKDAFNDYVAGLSKARSRFVPSDYRDLLNSYNDTEPMSELMDLRSMLLADQRGANNAGDYNRANVLNGIDQALFKGIPEGGVPLPSTAEQAATMAYQNASKTAAQYNADFNTQQPIASIFARNSTGGDRVLDSAVAEKLFAPGAGQADRVAQFTRVGGFDPEAMQAARDWFATKLQTSTQGAPQAGSSEAVLNASQLRKFVQSNSDLINSSIFNDKQRDAINQLVDARTLLERTANGGLKGGSDTAAKLLGNNYIGALLGKWLGAGVSAVGNAASAGGAALGSAAFGPAGAAVGSAAGRTIGELPQSLYAGAGEKINGLLVNAMRDPELARQLMMRATPKNSFVTNPYLISLLGMPPTVEATQTIP